MTTEIFVLSYERPELLACTLAGLCGFNAGLPIHVIDDGSADPRVMPLLARYQEAGLIESVERRTHGGIGSVRRRMIDRFLGSGTPPLFQDDAPSTGSGQADQLVQVEADVLVGPGQVAALLTAYARIQAAFPRLHFLNAFHHFWVRPQLQVVATGEFRVGITRGASEPFWTSDRASLRRAVSEGLLPADRPDLVLWLDKHCGATLYQPEISCQHIGAGKASLLYPDFSWVHVVFRQENERLKDEGPLRQPFPEHPLTWPAFEREMPQSALGLYEYLRGKSPVPLPPFRERYAAPLDFPHGPERVDGEFPNGR